ncbi:N-acetyltransferase family protein [Tepidimonas sp.]|uniref:GNAT family N-acetyltransferase n=1 Tax=Tepidimonas sp. TaxID=2002775 RepID=UPI00391CB48B
MAVSAPPPPHVAAPARGERVPVRDLPAATDPGPVRVRRPRAPIRTLEAEHRDAILRHLLALGERDRYLRFGYAAQDEHIRRYVDGLRFGLDEVFGIFNRRLELIAMAHLAYMVSPERGSDSAEFGVSVSAHARGRGYGHQLFGRAVVHARNHGVRYLYIHALSENAPMLRIARSAGATVVQHAGESECHLELPPADFESHVSELIEEEVARTDYWLKAYRRWWRRLVRWLTARG